MSGDGSRFGGTSFAKHASGIDPFGRSAKPAFTKAAEGRDTTPSNTTSAAGGGTATAANPVPRPPDAGRVRAARERIAARQPALSPGLSR